jgi:hypothetical protein
MGIVFGRRRVLALACPMVALLPSACGRIGVEQLSFDGPGSSEPDGASGSSGASAGAGGNRSDSAFGAAGAGGAGGAAAGTSGAAAGATASGAGGAAAGVGGAAGTDHGSATIGGSAGAGGGGSHSVSGTAGASGAGGAAAGASGAAGSSELGPFGPPVLIPALSAPTAADDDPSLTPDLLELYLCSNRLGGLGGEDIWVSSRASKSDPWGSPSLVVELSSVSTESTVGVSSDGLTIWFGSNRAGCVGDQDIWVSTRASREDPWSPPACVTELSSTAADVCPAATPDLLTMVLSSNRPGGAGSYDLYLAERASIADAWGQPVSIVELNTAGHEGEGVLVAGGLRLYFTCIRTGSADRDVYVASRASTGDLFDSPVPVAELNGAGQDSDLWLSEDQRYGVFFSDRDGNAELYETSR